MNRIIQELDDPKINQSDSSITRQIFNKLEKGTDVFTRVSDVDNGETESTFDSGEIVYCGLPKLADRLVVWDRSGMGEGLPISILKRDYPNWLNRKEIVEKEISKFVSEGKTESRLWKK